MTPGTPLRAALYARISTDDRRQNLDAQLGPLRQCAAARGWNAVEYVDEISGSRDRRPGLDRLLADMRAGRVNVVAVVSLDRLGRSLKHLVTLLDDFTERHVSFVSLRESIDMTTSAGRLVCHVFAALAEFERGLISERVKAGMRAAKARGVRIGRIPRLTKAVVADVVRRRHEGESYTTIARALRIPRSSIVRAARLARQGAGPGSEGATPRPVQVPVATSAATAG